MPFIIRQSQHYWVLAACIVLVAILYKADFQSSNQATTYYPGQTAAPTQTEAQSQAIGNVVSGSIGINRERGDSVFVVVRK